MRKVKDRNITLNKGCKLVAKSASRQDFCVPHGLYSFLCFYPCFAFFINYNFHHLLCFSLQVCCLPDLWMHCGILVQFSYSLSHLFSQQFHAHNNFAICSWTLLDGSGPNKQNDCSRFLDVVSYFWPFRTEPMLEDEKTVLSWKFSSNIALCFS